MPNACRLTPGIFIHLTESEKMSSDKKIVIRSEDLKSSPAERTVRVTVPPKHPPVAHHPSSNRKFPILLVSVAGVIVAALFVVVLVLVTSGKDDPPPIARKETDGKEVKPVDTRQVREQIEKRARIDALDEMRRCQPDRLISELTVKELAVVQDNSQYLAKLIVTIKSEIVVIATVANTSTHRLELSYGSEGQYIGLKSVEDITTFGINVTIPK
jgi:hypothetical protein